MADQTVKHNEPEQLQPIVQAHKWHNEALDAPGVMLPAGRVADLLDTTFNVARGVRAIGDILAAQMLHDNDSENYAGILSVDDKDALLRLATVSASMLVGECERFADWAHEHHTPEGRKFRAQVAAVKLPEARRG